MIDADTRHRAGRFPVDRLSESFALEDAELALRAGERGDVVKPVLSMRSGE